MNLKVNIVYKVLHNKIVNSKVYKVHSIVYIMKDKQRDDVKIVSDILKTRSNGFSITQVKEKSKIPRCSVVSALNKLEGAEKVDINFFGMSKVYSWKK